MSRAWSPTRVPDVSGERFVPAPDPGAVILPAGIATAESFGAPGVTTPAYTLAGDRQLVAWYEPSTGLVQQATYGVDGDLTNVGAAVTIGGSFDGLPAYQIRAKTGTTGYMRSAVTTTTFKQPVSVWVVGRFGAAATINTAMCASAAGGVASFNYVTNTQVSINGAVFPTTTPLNYHLYEIIYHSNFTYLSIDGGAFVQYNAGTGGDWGGVLLGAQTGGINPTDCDVLHFSKLEGWGNNNYRQQQFARLKALLPTTLTLSSAPAALPTFTTVAPAVFDYTQPWDAFIFGGQSNNSNFASDNASAAWIAGTFLLGNDYVWKVGGDPAAAFQSDSPTNQTDTVSLDPVGSRGALHGAVLNAMRTATGRPAVGVPCAISASYVVPGTTPAAPNQYWGREWVRGHRIQNALYWSMVARAREVLRWGGTINLIWYSGESEAQNASGAIRSAFPAALQALIDSFWDDIGIPNPRFNDASIHRTIIVRIAAHGNAGWTNMRDTVFPTIIQTPRQRMVDAPANGPFVDGVPGVGIHLNSPACDALGALVAAALLAA